MLNGYSPIRPLGSGATGIVFLAGRTPPGDSSDSVAVDDAPAPAGVSGSPELVAVKAFRTSRDHDLHLCKNEETVLRKLSSAALSHPFLPKFYSAVDDGDFRFLITTYCAGGDLNSLRRSQPDRKFSTSAIRFYAAEIILALEQLHSLGIVYRDLKPGNILLSEDGHIMLSDFDLSAILTPKTTSPSHNHKKTSENPHAEAPYCEDEDEEDAILRKPNWLCFIRPRKRKSPPGVNTTRIVPASSSSDEGDVASGGSDKSHSFVGTEEYMAPEVISGTGHDFAVDWWSLGVLLFEMAYGKSPFRGRHGDTYHNILHSEPRFPLNRKFHKNEDMELRDLITKLLIKDPRRRLGACCGAVEVKGHGFFAGISSFTTEGMRSRPAPKIDGAQATAPAQTGRTFDLTAHLVAIECSRSEARAKKKVRAHMNAPHQRLPLLE